MAFNQQWRVGRKIRKAIQDVSRLLAIEWPRSDGTGMLQGMKTSKLWRYDADCPKLTRFHFISFLHRVSLLSQCQNRTLHKSRPAADVAGVQTARPTMQAEPSNKLPKAHRKHLTSQYLTILTCFGFDSWCSGKDCSTLCFLYSFHGACLLAEWFGR